MNILDEILVRTARSRSPYHVYQTRSPGGQHGEESSEASSPSSPSMHFFYNDGALFSQISDALGQRFVYRITEDLQRLQKAAPSRDTN